MSCHTSNCRLMSSLTSRKFGPPARSSRSSHRSPAIVVRGGTTPCRGRRISAVAMAGLLVMLPIQAVAEQADLQLWGNVTLSWIKSHDFTFGLDVEPKVLVSKPSDVPGWATLEVTPSIEYTRGNWFDVIGELVVARTRQTDDVSSTEIAPRIGFRLHVLSNLANDLLKEKRPKRRLVIRDLFRAEWRNFYYSNDQPDSSSLRVRNRVEVQYPLTRLRTTDDGGVYALGDVELFWPVSDVAERFANKQRVRVGIGHRHSRAWRVEALYIWDRSRDAASDDFASADHVIDVRVHRVW